jgi:hypothetical protein
VDSVYPVSAEPPFEPGADQEATNPSAVLVSVKAVGAEGAVLVATACVFTVPRLTHRPVPTDDLAAIAMSYDVFEVRPVRVYGGLVAVAVCCEPPVPY